MSKHNPTTGFAHGMSGKALTIEDRVLAFLYFHSVVNDTGASLKDLVADFERAGLGKPNITNLRAKLIRNKSTSKVAKDTWRLRADKLKEVEKKFGLDACLAELPIKSAPLGNYIDQKRLENLRAGTAKFDYARLIQMLLELDTAFAMSNYISVIVLVRAILDHVPPLFGMNTFNEVVNQYGGTRSFKESMANLENSSRKIADAYLHTKIRAKESLPTKTQVNFSNDIDVLLAEIIRINP